MSKDSSEKITLFEKISYGFGAIGYNASFWWVSAFFAIYYTDTIAVPAGMVSLLLLVVRIWDAINDPLIGSIADRTKTRWGRYRPWLVAAGIGLPFSIIAMFSAKAHWSISAKVVWMFLWYFIVEIMSTCYDMPYSALHGAMSPKAKDRVSISSIRLAFSQIGTQITGVFGIILVIALSNAGGLRTEHGYTSAVALICLLTMPFALWTPIKCKERVLPPPNQENIPLKGQFQTLLKNKPIWLVTFGMLAFGFIGYGRSSMMIYYCAYVAGNAAYMSIFSLVNMFGSLSGAIFIMPFLYSKIRNKGKVAGLAMLTCFALCVVIYFVPPCGIAFWIITFLTGASMGTFSSTQYSMLGDAVDYGEYKVGLRCDGFLSSFTSTAVKLGGAISPSLGLALIAKANYIPNAVQSAEVQKIMNMCISFIPAISVLIPAICYLAFYKLDEKSHEEVRKELERRREIKEV